MLKQKQFITLEGMRGIAAIAIVIFHGQDQLGSMAPKSAYLAVDFFFVLSGFIMAHVYGERLDQSLSSFAFLRARLVRLYPMYLAGTLLGVAIATASLFPPGTGTLWRTMNPLVSLPPALVMMPSPASAVLFPLDLPAWSLLLELVANLVFASRPMRTARAMLCLMAVSAVALAVASCSLDGFNYGWAKSEAGVGLARVFFSFPAGVLLYRVRSRVRLPTIPTLLPILALAAALYAAPSGQVRVAYDLVFVTVLSPALLLAAAATNPLGRRLHDTYGWLGAVSYPLYTLHHPVLIAAMGVLSRHAPPGFQRQAAALGFIAALILLARAGAEIDRRIGRGLDAAFRHREARAQIRALAKR